MTQPPSQQPPQGGFGSPQDPRGVPRPPARPPAAPPAPPAQPPAAPPPAQAAPGYGFPQAPGQPPAPGYGHPQAPGPYAQPGPYPQPGPYAQPGPYPQPGPYAQPGPYGGHPTQPPHPGGPVPPGGGPSRGRTTAVIAAAVAALLAVGGVTTWALTGNDEDGGTTTARPSDSGSGPSASVDKGDGTGGGREAEDDLNAGRQPGEAKVEWLLKNDVDLPRNGADVYGPWVVGDTIAKAMYRGVEGFSTADGEKKWSIPFTTDVCEVPHAPTANGVIVVGLKDGTGDRADCRVLQQVDLKSGKAGWRTEVPKSTGFNALSDPTLAMAGNTVVAAGTGSSYGFSLTDGKQVFGKPSDGCQPYAFAGAGTRLVAAASCRVSDYKNPQQEVWDVDPATGKPKWKYQLARGWEVDKVYSASPLVVNAVHEEKKQRTILVLSDAGKLRSQLSGGGDKYRTQCGGGFVVFGQRLQGCAGVAADADTFYMSTEPTALTRGTNDVVAFDLGTGKPKWRAKAGPDKTMLPLRMEGGKLLVYIEGSWDRGGAVATLAPTGGKPTVLLQHPASVARIERDFWQPRYEYADGRFFIASGRVSARDDKAELETKTMIAFGG
ncbi:PQQ-like beta-propeller repeat protein [Streptomyces sp. MRC013]|uniref:outer membrane protein assembly factor BamB family protein n=1 Tax=Streptomyces sp. MRC013 TaxID=2898276 RepID=UPI002026296F|nr:PQQ-binding-like beta-propeller repeat protein [Streptomyces sp. MRC013]URM91082.1 PQQ-like beta-propeller repeat protein [Streptomyces sp. MRC013]